MIALGVVFVLIGAIAVTLMVALAVEHGVEPSDVAIAYERAWDDLDFDGLWTLSSPRLREGLARGAFASAKKAAYASRRDLAGLVESVEVESVERDGDRASARTRVHLHDGSEGVNELRLIRAADGWRVDSYDLVPAGGSPDVLHAGRDAEA